MSLHHEMQDRAYQEDREADLRAEQERRDRREDYTPVTDLSVVSPAIVEWLAEQELARRIPRRADETWMQDHLAHVRASYENGPRDGVNVTEATTHGGNREH